jgi:hypothetical protein
MEPMLPVSVSSEIASVDRLRSIAWVGRCTAARAAARWRRDFQLAQARAELLPELAIDL